MATQKMLIDEKVTRKIRKLLTRKPDGKFEVCDVHERRMRATSFETMIIADPESHEVSIHATAEVSCGHSKNACTDSRTVTIANAAGLNADLAKKLSLVTLDEKDEKEEAA